MGRTLTGMEQTIDEVYAEAVRLARVHRLTRGLDPQDQQDIAHEAVIGYLAAYPDGARPANVSAWLEVAVRNEATDFLRKRRRRREHEELPSPDTDVDDVLASLRTLSTPSLAPVRSGLLEQLMGLLPPVAADVLRLRFVDDLDAAEVAARLGIGRAAVDQRVARAKRQLREALAAHPDLLAELRRPHPRLYPGAGPHER